MDRKREQAEILFKLGQLFGPLLNLAESPDSFDREDQSRILAPFSAEVDKFLHRHLTKYTEGEPGHAYNVEFRQCACDINFVVSTRVGGGQGESWYKLVRETVPKVIETIQSIPVPVDSAIYEARTPFSTYCFVKDLCSTVRTQIVWLDRYFDQTLFHRFLRDTPVTAQVTLVTLPDTSAKGKSDLVRYAEFMDVSRLFAAERGPQGYRLVAKPDFHDRWLRCDDKLFALGGSIKDLAKPFTISKLDSTPENVRHFDDAIAQGVEVFGPNHPTHP